MLCFRDIQKPNFVTVEVVADIDDSIERKRIHVSLKTMFQTVYNTSPDAQDEKSSNILIGVSIH